MQVQKKREGAFRGRPAAPCTKERERPEADFAQWETFSGEETQNGRFVTYARKKIIDHQYCLERELMDGRRMAFSRAFLLHHSRSMGCFPEHLSKVL